MGIRLERKTSAKLAPLKFDNAFWDQVAAVYEGDILSRFLQQKQVSGERIKVIRVDGNRIVVRRLQKSNNEE